MSISTNVFLLLMPLITFASISQHEVQTAIIGDHNQYRTNTTVRGGDALANPVALSSIRWGKKKQFERIVIDLQGEGKGWESSVPPYFQVGIGKKDIDVSIRSINQVTVNKASLAYLFKKSKFIEKVYIAPQIQGDLAALRFDLKNNVSVNSFYLVRPPRIILDIRAQ